MGKETLRVTDIFELTPVSDPQISPDGSAVAFVRQYWRLAENASRMEVWLADTKTKAVRPFATSGNHNSAPRWAPDGSRLCFLSDRSGRNQLYVIPCSGGEGAVVATEEEPVSPGAWSPDGQSIAFEAKVHIPPEEPQYPGAPAASCVPKLDPVREKDGVKVLTTLRNRVEPGGYHGNWWKQLMVVPSSPTTRGEKAPVRQLTGGRFHHEQPVWSPDGAFVACLANREAPGESTVHHSHLWVFSVSTGEGVRAFREDYRIQLARFSPDGKTIAIVGSRSPVPWDEAPWSLCTVDFDVSRYPESWDAVRCLSDGFDRPLGGNSLAWSLDSKVLHATVADGGQVYLLRVPVDEPQRRTQLRGTTPERQAFSISSSRAGHLAYLVQTPTQPAEIYTMTPDGRENRITSINLDWAAKHSLVSPERLHCRASDGWDIDAWIMKPSDYVPGKAYPTVLCVHGGPAAMYGYNFEPEFQLLANHGFAVVFANPRGSYGYRYEFMHAVVGDWGGKDYLDLMAAVDEAIRLGVADPDLLGITGWSYGGFMTYWAITHSNLFKAAVAGAAISDQVSMLGSSDVGFEFTAVSIGGTPWSNPERLLSRSPVTLASNVAAPLLILHGERDLRVPPGQADEMYTALVSQGKTCVLIRYPGEGHGFGQPHHLADRWERVVAWFARFLGPMGCAKGDACDGQG